MERKFIHEARFCFNDSDSLLVSHKSGYSKLHETRSDEDLRVRTWKG